MIGWHGALPVRAVKSLSGPVTFKRNVAVVNGLGEFAPVLEEALEVESMDDVGKVGGARLPLGHRPSARIRASW